jgi:carboxyl-terminal processing protease
MMQKKFLLPLLAVFVLTISSFTLFQFSRNQILLDMLMSALNQAHYSPLTINDEFSDKAFKLYLKNLDYSKKMLTQDDVDALSKYRKQIDDEVNNGTFEFFELSYSLISKRIKEKEQWSKELLEKPMDYSIDEEYESDGEKIKYATSETELKNEWRKWLKYQVVARIDEALTAQEKADSVGAKPTVKKSFDSLEVDARRKTLKANQDWFKRLNKITYKERFSAYVNTITGIYDPHTEYFAPKDKKKFDQSMSGQFEGIGARLQSKDGFIRVSEVIPGSPSAKQGELKAGDEIHKVAQGSAEPADVTNMEMDEAIELIKGRKGTEVKLTVKKPDGSFKIIPIVRDIIEIDETYAKSAILENKKKIGYIYLPMFYADFTRNGAHRCAADMRKELEKLKKQVIPDIITHNKAFIIRRLLFKQFHIHELFHIHQDIGCFVDIIVLFNISHPFLLTVQFHGIRGNGLIVNDWQFGFETFDVEFQLVVTLVLVTHLLGFGTVICQFQVVFGIVAAGFELF